jgi:hypothetical protein
MATVTAAVSTTADPAATRNQCLDPARESFDMRQCLWPILSGSGTPSSGWGTCVLDKAWVIVTVLASVTS